MAKSLTSRTCPTTRQFFSILLFVAFISAFGLCGCVSGRFVSNRQNAAATASVRKVDCSEASEMRELAARARQLGDRLYPKILTLLAEDASKLPRQFDIVFKKQIKGDNRGEARGTRIWLNAGYLQRHPT